MTTLPVVAAEAEARPKKKVVRHLLFAGALGLTALTNGCTQVVTPAPPLPACSLPTQGLDNLVADVADGQSRLLIPCTDKTTAPALDADGDLRVTTWNLHHNRGRDVVGRKGPPQLLEIIDQLRRHPSDVYLLQEVPPQQAQHLVDALRMPGYYSRTLDRQGNLVLVHPDLQVTHNARAIINGGFETGDLDGANNAIARYRLSDGPIARQTNEPRSLQMLRLHMPEATLVVWNTHLTAGAASSRATHASPTLGQIREREAADIASHLDAFAREGEPVVGGGDMNSRPQGPVVLTFVGRGHTLLSDRAGPGIDWIVQRGTGDMRVTDNAFMHHNDTQLSDHPLLSVEVSQGAPTADT